MKYLAATLLFGLLASWQIAAPAPTGMSPPLRGVVYGADGKPASGATVWAVKSEWDKEVRADTVANADGKYELNAEPGHWMLWARRGTQGGEGRLPQFGLGLSVKADAPLPPIDIRLEERGTLRGKLVEMESGRPLANALVYFDDGFRLSTNAEGRFEIGGLKRGHHEALAVVRGYGRARFLFDRTDGSETELEIPVGRGAEIKGQVLDADGKPVPGAFAGRFASGSTWLGGRFEVCDAEGRFQYHSGYPDLTTEITAGAPGFRTERRYGLPLFRDKPLELEFLLLPEPKNKQESLPGDLPKQVLSGTVLGPDGKPAVGVLVRWGFDRIYGVIETHTDAAGLYSLTVPAQKKFLSVYPKNLAPEFVTIGAGDQKLEAITLKAGSTAVGKVTDDDGKPLAGVSVTAVIPTPDPRDKNSIWLTESRSTTDADGRFEIKGNPDTSRFDFSQLGYSMIRKKELNMNGAINDVVMQHEGALKGRVIDKDGKPIRNFRILVNYPLQRDPKDFVAGLDMRYTMWGVNFASDDGSFIFSGLTAGSLCSVRAVAKGHGEAVVDRKTIIGKNKLATAEPVVIQAAAANALAVTIEAGDKPVAGANVTLVSGQISGEGIRSWFGSGWEDTIARSSNDKGIADFSALSHGGGTLFVKAPGYGRQRITWHGAPALSVKLLAEAVLTGEIEMPKDQEQSEYVLTLTFGDQKAGAIVRKSDAGKFRVDQLAPGLWTLSVRTGHDFEEIHNRQVSLSDGETTDIAIVLKK